MRRRRLRAPEYFDHAVYHCVSRVVDRQFVLQEAEREQFVRFMRLYERLYGLQVVTFCIMSNHFHILVSVPSRPEVLPDDGGLVALVALVRETQGDGAADNLANWLGRWREQGNEVAAEQEIEAVRRNRGRLPRHEYLRLRVRYFTDGAILGTKTFVENVFQARRAWFSPRRKTAVRPLSGLDRSDLLRSARALKVRPLG